MEENLNNQQVRPGDRTQLMHVVFSSDEEMMAFYLTLYRLIYPGSYLVQCTDQQMLENLKNTLYKNVLAFEVVNDYKAVSIKEVIKGFGMNMMNTGISNSNRLQSADMVGNLMNCILGTTKNIGQFGHMSRINYLHIENVTYLLKRLKEKADEEKESEIAV